jgi:hypothetical protein
MLDEASYQQMVFGNRNAQAVRDRFERLLALKLAEVDRMCDLDSSQEEKLQLAGRGDVKRLFDRVDVHRKSLNRQLTQDEYVKINQDIRPLQAALNADPFGGGSLLAKALRGVLDDRQSARYQQAERDKARQRHRAKAEQLVLALDGTLGLSADQRRRLTALLVDETRPPGKTGPYDLMIVLYQASRLPEPRLRPIFDDAQWRSLQRHFLQAKSLERVLTAQDLLPDAAPPGADAAAGRHGHD